MVARSRNVTSATLIVTRSDLPELGELGMLGAFVALGIGLAFILTILVVPAYIATIF